jgi:hypothetical protein
MITIGRIKPILFYKALGVELFGVWVNAAIMVQCVCWNGNSCAELYMVAVAECPTTRFHDFSRTKG